MSSGACGSRSMCVGYTLYVPLGFYNSCGAGGGISICEPTAHFYCVSWTRLLIPCPSVPAILPLKPRSTSYYTPRARDDYATSLHAGVAPGIALVGAGGLESSTSRTARAVSRVKNRVATRLPNCSACWSCAICRRRRAHPVRERTKAQSPSAKISCRSNTLPGGSCDTDLAPIGRR
eukprot:1191202-Prorocentrum_minimum.AAC.7